MGSGNYSYIHTKDFKMVMESFFSTVLWGNPIYNILKAFVYSGVVGWCHGAA